jgi:tRNA(Ile)-lysidine synthase
MLEIITKIDKTVEKYSMLQPNDFVVIGVSGGADSMLLLNYFLSKRDELQLKLLVANVEHGIRGQASIDDSAFVKKFCDEHNVDFKGISIIAIEGAKELGISVEEYSRNKRYDFLNYFNADKIATAHNLSDNVETVLFRLSRGTSIKGCCGIPPVRNNIIRPLINLSSQEIRQACKDNNIPYVYDETNSDNTYSRNYVRNKIIPDFTALNSSFEGVFSRFINSVNEDEAFIEKEANKCFDACFKNNALIIDKLNKFDASIVKRAIIKFTSIYGVTLDDMHLNGVYALTKNPGRFQIKDNIFAISDKKRFRIAIFEQAINFDDIIVNKKVTSRADFLTNCELLQKQFAFYCDYDKIDGNISVRPRDEGDEIVPSNRGCTKSLKKLYNELKIPVEERESIPVLCDNKGVIGVYGYCVDERVKIDNTTTSVILLNIRMED